MCGFLICPSLLSWNKGFQTDVIAAILSVGLSVFLEVVACRGVRVTRLTG